MAPPSENTPRKQGGPWPKGTSGNPSGRPKGARNRTTRALEALLDGEADAVTRALVEAAKGGDVTAGRVILDRLLPPAKGRTVEFDMPLVNSAADLPNATAALLKAVADGAILPGEAVEVGKVLEVHLKALEVADLDARLTALEEKQR